MRHINIYALPTLRSGKWPIHFRGGTTSTNLIDSDLTTGRNSFCIDKNYGGVLIVWDRLFATFQEEKANICFGLTKNIKTFDPIAIQFHHFNSIVTKFNRANCLEDKYKSLLAGPGWQSATRPLGHYKHIEGQPKESEEAEQLEQLEESKYDPQILLHHKLYVLVHFAIVVIIHTNLMQSINVLPHYRAIVCSIYILISLTSFGFIMDSKKWSLYFEMFRCFLFVLLEHKAFNVLINETNFNIIILIQYTYMASIGLLFADHLFAHYRLIGVHTIKAKQ